MSDVTRELHIENAVTSWRAAHACLRGESLAPKAQHERMALGYALDAIDSLILALATEKKDSTT